MGTEFNKISRKLFSAMCPVSECHEGKPSDRYVDYKLYESYFNLLGRFVEFESQFYAIKSGCKTWSREFEIDGCRYEVKTLDNLVPHTFEDLGSFSQTYLPEGYIRADSGDGESMPVSFAEFYETIQKNPELLCKFDKEFAKAEKFDITGEYFSDLRIIFANTLSAMHAIAADAGAFNKMLNLLGEHHPAIRDFLLETYKSCDGLSQVLEHQALITLKEREKEKLARPKTLEDVVDEGIWASFASAAKKVACTLPGLLMVATSASAAVGSSSQHSNSHGKIPVPTDYKMPCFDIADTEKFLPGTPQKISNPAAGDDNNVANNHANGLSDQQQFTAGGKPIVFYNEVAGPDGFIYKQYWLYYTDNPAYVIMPGFKDHHAHDWEVITDKCTSSGGFIERAVSFHVKFNGLQLERGWKFINNCDEEILVEVGGHAMSPSTLDFGNLFNFVVKDPANNEDLHPVFEYPIYTKSLLPGSYAVVSMQSIIDNSQLDSQDRYKTEGYPDAASTALGDASKVPWKSNVFNEPWKIFDDKSQSEAKTWINSIEGSNLEARLVYKGSRHVLGMENNVEKADIPGVYVKSGSNIFLASDFTGSYDNAQLEIYGTADSHYKIDMCVTKNVNGESVAEGRTIEKDIKKGETQVIKLNSADLQPTVEGDNSNQSSSISWSLLGMVGIVAGTLAAAGISYHYMQHRKKQTGQNDSPEQQAGMTKTN
jgi:hypothetical protein